MFHCLKAYFHLIHVLLQKNLKIDSPFEASQFNSDRGGVLTSKFLIHQAFWGVWGHFPLFTAHLQVGQRAASAQHPCSFNGAAHQPLWEQRRVAWARWKQTHQSSWWLQSAGPPMNTHLSVKTVQPPFAPRRDLLQQWSVGESSWFLPHTQQHSCYASGEDI